MRPPTNRARSEIVEECAACEPDGRRDRAHRAEDVGTLEERVEADQPAHRRADRRGAFALPVVRNAASTSGFTVSTMNWT